jgi:phospho-N-acetylmuramoyl-pentapeptide-transferase
MLSGLAGAFLAGLVLALLGGLALLPLLRSLKARQFISSDAPQRHQVKAGTPTMGGLIIIVGGLLPPLFMAGVADRPRLYAVLLATLGFGLVGFLDDLLIILRGRNLGLRAREKLLGQFIVAIAFTAWFVLADPGGPQPTAGTLRWVLAAYYVLLMVGMSNAVNLTDGLDGLAAGVSLPVWLALALLGVFAPGVFDPGYGVGVPVFCAAMAGATLGYLWYNAHPAQVFMGDTGSLAIGGGMAAAGIALHQEWLLLVAALVHLVEAASVTLQVISFKTTGKRIFKMSPLHHHFELCEVPETRIVARFAIASALCGLAALLIGLRTL